MNILKEIKKKKNERKIDGKQQKKFKNQKKKETENKKSSMRCSITMFCFGPKSEIKKTNQRIVTKIIPFGLIFNLNQTVLL